MGELTPRQRIPLRHPHPRRHHPSWLIENAAEEDADKVQQAHGHSHEALRHDIGRGDDGCDQEDQDNGNAAALLHDLGVCNAHLGQNDGDQRHFKHTAEDDEHGQAEVDVALDADGCRDVIGTLQRNEEVQHERQGDLVGEQHTHAEQRQTEQQHQPEEEALAPFQAGFCKGVDLIQRHRDGHDHRSDQDTRKYCISFSCGARNTKV